MDHVVNIIEILEVEYIIPSNYEEVLQMSLPKPEVKILQLT